MPDVTEEADGVLKTEVLPIRDLRDSGLLYLINKTVFHPRGFALAVSDTGWQLWGNGDEPWHFEIEDENDLWDNAMRFMRLVTKQTPLGGHDAGS